MAGVADSTPDMPDVKRKKSKKHRGTDTTVESEQEIQTMKDGSAFGEVIAVNTSSEYGGAASGLGRVDESPVSIVYCTIGLLNALIIRPSIDWLIDWLSDRPYDWLIDCSRGDGLIDWMLDRLIDWWLIDWLSDWPYDWLIDWSSDRPYDWLIDCSSGDWLIDWLNAWSIHWLIDWLIKSEWSVHFPLVWSKFCYNSCFSSQDFVTATQSSTPNSSEGKRKKLKTHRTEVAELGESRELAATDPTLVLNGAPATAALDRAQVKEQRRIRNKEKRELEKTLKKMNRGMESGALGLPLTADAVLIGQLPPANGIAPAPQKQDLTSAITEKEETLEPLQSEAVVETKEERRARRLLRKSQQRVAEIASKEEVSDSAASSVEKTLILGTKVATAANAMDMNGHAAALVTHDEVGTFSSPVFSSSMHFMRHQVRNLAPEAKAAMFPGSNVFEVVGYGDELFF